MIASTQTNHPLYPAGDKVASQNRVEAACKVLRASGLRITQPRIAILKTLVARGRPLSIEQIHSELNCRSCDLVTVYRCLAAFQEIGLVRRSFLPNGTSLYHLNDLPNAAYHIVSTASDEVYALEVATSERLAAAVREVEDRLRQEGFNDVSHLLQFFARPPGVAAPVSVASEERSVVRGQAAVPADL